MISKARTAVIACLLLAITACAPGWDKSSFTLEDVLINRDNPAVVANPQEATTELCVGVSECIEAWRTDQANYYRFKSNDAAASFAKGLGNLGHHSNRVVIDFTGKGVTAETRRAVEEGVDGAHSSQ